MSAALDEAKRVLPVVSDTYRAAVAAGDKQTALALLNRIAELQARIARLSKRE